MLSLGVCIFLFVVISLSFLLFVVSLLGFSKPLASSFSSSNLQLVLKW